MIQTKFSNGGLERKSEYIEFNSPTFVLICWSKQVVFQFSVRVSFFSVSGSAWFLFLQVDVLMRLSIFEQIVKDTSMKFVSLRS